jgi:hypothetical protein
MKQYLSCFLSPPKESQFFLSAHCFVFYICINNLSYKRVFLGNVRQHFLTPETPILLLACVC